MDATILLELGNPHIAALDTATSRPLPYIRQIIANMARVPVDLGPVGQRDKDRPEPETMRQRLLMELGRPGNGLVDAKQSPISNKLPV